MKKKNLSKISQAFCILAFAGFAMASTTSKSAVEYIDAAAEGWTEGKKYRSENDLRPENQDVEHSAQPDLTSLGFYSTIDDIGTLRCHNDCDVRGRQKCSTCNGTGKVNDKICVTCNGKGSVSK